MEGPTSKKKNEPYKSKPQTLNNVIGFLSQWPYVLEAVFFFFFCFLQIFKISESCKSLLKNENKHFDTGKNHVFPSFPPKKIEDVNLSKLVSTDWNATRTT